MKKLTALALALSLALTLALPALAAGDTTESNAAADTLYALGLFQGKAETEDGTPVYALGDKANRGEALVMLLRLMGLEDEALSEANTHPFTDTADWLSPYVGYAYAKGLTQGVEETSFGGASPATANMYLTFTLRALGYSDSGEEPDFSYSAAAAFADSLGLTSGEYAGGEEVFRGDLALISKSALSRATKAGETLMQKLVTERAVKEAAAKAAGFTVAPPPPLQPVTLSVKTVDMRRFLVREEVLSAFPTAEIMLSASTMPGFYEQEGRAEEPMLIAFEHISLMYYKDVYYTQSDYDNSIKTGELEFSGGEYLFLMDAAGECVAAAKWDGGSTVTFHPEPGYSATKFLAEFDARYAECTASARPDLFTLEQHTAYRPSQWDPNVALDRFFIIESTGVDLDTVHYGLRYFIPVYPLEKNVEWQIISDVFDLYFGKFSVYIMMDEYGAIEKVEPACLHAATLLRNGARDGTGGGYYFEVGALHEGYQNQMVIFNDEQGNIISWSLLR